MRGLFLLVSMLLLYGCVADEDLSSQGRGSNRTGRYLESNYCDESMLNESCNATTLRGVIEGICELRTDSYVCVPINSSNNVRKVG